MKQLKWRKSSFTDNGACVEVADDGADVLVRNSNHPDRGHIPLDRTAMAAWLDGIKAGEFDDLG